MENVTVILRDGSETTLEAWQKLYGLPIGSNSIGKHFSLNDSKIAENLRQYKKVVVNELLMRVMDAYRDMSGKPCILNAFNRSQKKQEELQNDDRFAAATYSPHVVYMAADIDTKDREDTINMAGLLITVAAKLGIKIRVGYKEYLNLPTPMTFVHIDVCPEYYAKGKPFHEIKHPVQWENQITW